MQVAAAKQCGRNRLMEVRASLSWREFASDADSNALRWMAHPTEDLRSGTAPLPSRGERDVIVAVGPEGGFSDAEVQLALDSGWQGLHLGPRVLRVETAAVAIAAAVSLT